MSLQQLYILTDTEKNQLDKLENDVKVASEQLQISSERFNIVVAKFAVQGNFLTVTERLNWIKSNYNWFDAVTPLSLAHYTGLDATQIKSIIVNYYQNLHSIALNNWQQAVTSYTNYKLFLEQKNTDLLAQQNSVTIAQSNAAAAAAAAAGKNTVTSFWEKNIWYVVGGVVIVSLTGLYIYKRIKK